MKYNFEGKKILVTGGAGFIGQALATSLLEYNPAEVRIFDTDESNEFELRQKFDGQYNINIFLGNIRENDSLEQVMRGVDIVFHLAALKHVTACEYDPYEAVKTNINGTHNVMAVAKKEGVDVVIYTSSDKAVSPTSFMGITKLVGERIVSGANHKIIHHKTRLSSVRFGNVLGSSGSLLPLLEHQISQGGPVTITDEGMTRFVMGKSDAIDIIMESIQSSKGGEVFIKKMPSVRIVDLVEVMIEEIAPKHGFKPDDIERKMIGSYPGEKLFEEIMTEDENLRALETDDMFIVLSILDSDRQKHMSQYPGSHIPKDSIYKSEDAPLLSKEEIREMLISEELI